MYIACLRCFLGLVVDMQKCIAALQSNNGSNSVTMSQQEMEHDRFQSFSAVSLKKTYAMLGSIDEIMW